MFWSSPRCRVVVDLRNPGWFPRASSGRDQHGLWQSEALMSQKRHSRGLGASLGGVSAPRRRKRHRIARSVGCMWTG